MLLPRTFTPHHFSFTVEKSTLGSQLSQNAVLDGTAMWSGLFTHLTESWNNCKDLDPDYVTRIDMGKHGYPTQKLGKSEYTSGLHSVSNRVEAWTRDFDFLLQQEGRRVINLTGDKTHVKVMEAAWQNTDKAINWIKEEAINLTQPFVLHLGLYLPQPYLSPYVGENFGSSTFLTSPYWLEKMHPVDCYSSYRKNCTGEFTKQGVRNTRAFYYAMCAETDAMLDIARIPVPQNLSGYSLTPLLSWKG